MTQPWELVVLAALGLIALGALTTSSLLRRPTWLAEDPQLAANWGKLSWLSGLSGLIAGLIALGLVLAQGLHGQSIPLAAVLGFSVTHTLVTDFKLRYADRWTLRLASLVAFVVGCYILATYGIETDWLFYLVFAVAARAIGLLPGVGESDGRAFLLLVLATYPVAAFAGLQWSILLSVATVTLFFVIQAIRTKQFSPRILLAKFSFPMVPLVLAPALLVVLLSPWLPSF